MENQRGRSRKRKISPAKKAMNIFKRTVVAVLCFAMVAEYVPSSLTFAAEGEPVIESEGYTDEVTLDDLTEGTYEGDTGSGEETGTGTDNEADAESDPDEEGGSEEGAGEVTGDDEDEGTPDSEETPDSEDDDEEDAESDGEEDEESEEDAESENEADDEYTDADDEENAEGEDEDEEAEDEELVEEEEAAAGAGAAVVPSTSSVTSYKTVSATIYTDDTYEEKLSDGATIELSGKMPKGAEVKAYPVEVEIEDITVLAAYDITIFDEDGEEYEPDEDDVIEVTIENDEIREALEEERELTVFHMEDEDDEPEEIAKLPSKTKKPKFSARHFSIYIVGENGSITGLDGEEHFVYIVNFYDETAETLLSTQTVSAGEKMQQPAVPEKEHETFVGWFTEPNGGGTKYLDLTTDAMPEMPEGTTEDIKVDLYAHFESIYHVYYMTSNDESAVEFHTETYEYGDELITSTAEDLFRLDGYETTTQAIVGWVTVQGGNLEDNPAPETVTDDLELYPIIENAYWIYFDMNGKNNTSVDPQYILATETAIGELPEAECSGYKFTGWNTEADGSGTTVTAETTLAELNIGDQEGQNDSITLYAQWDADNVGYTVNIWKQKATDGQLGLDQKVVQDGETYENYITYYDYAESYHIDASESTLKSGDTPTNSVISDYTSWGKAVANDTSEYNGFEYNQTRTQNNLATITMASDGSTILNVFYDRVTITWTFYSNTQSASGTVWGTLIGLYGTNITPTNGSAAGGTKSAWEDYSSSSKWQFDYTTGSGRQQTTSQMVITFEAEFQLIDLANDPTNIKFYRTSFSSAYSIHYYLEVTNAATQVEESGDKAKEAEEYEIPYLYETNGTTYVYDYTTNASDATFHISSKYAGYDVSGKIIKTTTGQSRGTGNNRTWTYTTTYSDFEKVVDGDEQSSLKGSSNNNSSTAYELCLFNDAHKYTITLFSDSKIVSIGANDTPYYDSSATYTYQVAYGADLSNIVFPTELDGETFGPAYYYSFTGTWYEDSTLTAEFQKPTTMPAYNLAAYADWELQTITVTFVTAHSEDDLAEQLETLYGDKVVDNEDGSYSVTMLARSVLDELETLKPVYKDNSEDVEYTHVGWTDQNGKVFNFATVLYDDMTLTAIWKNEDIEGHYLHYDLNLGLADEDDKLSQLFVEGGAATLIDIEDVCKDLEIELDAEQLSKFICWNTAADGSGTNYYPEDVITFENQDITLYAVWSVEKEFTINLNHNYPEGYKHGDDVNDVDTVIGSNLTDTVDIEEVSGLEYHTEIKVSDDESSDGQEHTYRFDGWSTSQTSASSATDADVDVAADATITADTVNQDAVNTLYAVWLEVYSVTITKQIVNTTTNYNSSDDTFTFDWTVAEGDEHKDSGTTDSIKDTESVTIEFDVASGETVTIKETANDKYDTTYSGGAGSLADDGTYTFTMTSTATTITAINTLKTNTLTVSKEWKDADGKKETEVEHDAVTVHVYEVEGDRKEPIAELYLSSENNWTDSIEFVPDNGVGYSVTEDTVSGYTTVISGTVSIDGNISFTVTNTAVPNIDITVEKVWEDNDDQDGKRPTSVTVNLFADGDVVTGENGEAVTATITKGDDDKWTATFEDFPTTKDDGTEITYTISENTVADYTSEITGDQTVGFTVTNTHTVEMVNEDGNVTVNKIWDDNDNQDGKRDSYAVTLTGTIMVDDQEQTVSSDTQTLSADTATYTWTDMPKYSAGEEISYSVTESTVPDGYEASYGGDSETGFTVTNSYTPELVNESGEIKVTKVWVDDENRDGLESAISVQLYAGEDTSGETVELNKSNNWTYTWENLPKYADGNEIEYSVQETEVPTDYTVAYSGDAENGFTITNTHADYLVSEITITKVWDDDDNGNNTRPEEITVELQINGTTATAVDGSPWTATLTKANENAEGNWVTTVTDHPVYLDEEGHEISYVLHEEDVDGYSTEDSDLTVTKDSDGNYIGEVTITNKLLVTDWTVEKTLTNSGTGENGAFKAGETAEFTITVKNTGETDIAEIKVTEELSGAKLVESTDGSYTLDDSYTVATIKDLEVGKTVELSAEYTIKEDDIGKEITNTVTTSNGDSSKSGPEDTEDIPIENKNPHMYVTKTADIADDYVAKVGDSITYTITVTNDGNVTLHDITVSDPLTEETWTVDSLAPGATSEEFTATYEVTQEDIEKGEIVNTATAKGYDPDDDEVEDDSGDDNTAKVPTETPNKDNDRDFFDIDEEIVPDEGDSSTWEKDEEVEEKHAIEFEMTTTLPSLTEDDLKGLVEDGFTMVFHNDLDSELKLDSEESTDLHITIGGKTIGSEYYSIDINQSKDEWSVSTLSAKADDDGCAFHVNVDLSKLYEAELISADDFAGDTQITVFFYADLEGAVEGQKYESTVWYEVYDGEEAIYTSSKDTVTVHVKSTDYVPTKSVDKGEGITVYYGDSLTYTITYKNTSDEAATVTITDTLNNGLTFSSASDGGEYDSSSRTVTWTLENVEAGYEGSVTLTATVNSVGRTNGNVSNTAYVKVGDGEAIEASNAVTNPVYKSTSSGSSGSGSSGSATTISHVRNVNNGKTGHWILEGGYLTLPDGSHPSNEYLDVDGEIWAFYTYGYAVAKRHTQYYTDEAISAVGYIPRVTGTWETIGWWFEYDDGTYPHNEWALLEYNGLTYWYHFDVDGWMDDGWFTENGNTYYLDPVYDGWRGHMMTGWQLIGGSWYYFSEDPNTLGVMLKDTTTPDGYYVDANGRWIE